MTYLFEMKPLSGDIQRLPDGAMRAFPAGVCVRKRPMANSDEKRRYRGAVPISALVGRVISPVAQKRGFAAADLIAGWAEVVGADLAEWTRPEKVVWPRGEANSDRPGVLTLRVDGPRAVLVQHQLGQIIERVNAFFGYAAVGHVRIVQAPLDRIAKPTPDRQQPLAPEDEARLRTATSAVEDQNLREALDRLGRGVLKGHKQA